jgi:glycosyltransferase involved in cell wall biosynthesis
MKILFVIGSTELGGAEQHLLRLTTSLRQRNYEPSVFVLTPGGPLTALFEKSGVRVYGVSLPHWVDRWIRHHRLIAWLRLIYAAAALWWYLWTFRPKVVHYFLPAAYVVGGLVSLFGPPMRRIMSRRSLNHYQKKHKLFQRIEHWLHPRMDIICGNSEAVVRDLKSEGVKYNQLKLIYNGIDLNRFNNVRNRVEMRQSLGVGDEVLVFVVVANLIPYKGHADLIRALVSVRENIDLPWVCWCVGRDDGIEKELCTQAKELGIDKNVIFLGSRNDVPDLLCAADIGVLCSHEEGFSNAVLEGMAASLPMIVTNVGGNAEAIIDGECGYVVEPHSPSQLGKALVRIAVDSNRAKMGVASHARVIKQFSWVACVDAYESIYSE